jgi:amino acid adenylation domain-containing protein/non-ribosomal peptide synthase protein (TIGR01720 family)
VLRYLGGDAEARALLAAQPGPEISFRYLDEPGAEPSPTIRLMPVGGPRGLEMGEANRRRHLLEVEGAVVDGCLRLSWTYGEGTHRRETVERVAQWHLEELRELIAHCSEEGAGGYTPSDFPLAGLDQAELDALLGSRRGVEDLYPLSPMQEGLLFHALYGGSHAYHVQIAQRMQGDLDTGLFRRAWQEAVNRHAFLRTSFVSGGGLRRPLQRVESAVEVPWTEEDWRGRSAEEQETALERYLAEGRARGFALDRAPLLRLAVFRVADDAYWVVYSQHPMLLDGWTASQVRGQVYRLYRAWTRGEAEERRPVRPYREYIEWVGRQDPAAAERYWREVLRGFTAPTPLTVDRTARAGAGGRYARRMAALTVEQTQRLEEAARRCQVTLNTALQGAWGLLLSRYSGEEDVVFGNTVSGRPAELDGVEEMIGALINTLPVRMRLRGDVRLGAWLRELQQTQVEAREYGYAPLAQVQGWSEVPHGKLFESLFVFENYPAEYTGSGRDRLGLRLERPRTTFSTNYPLSLIAGTDWQLHLMLSYDESRFEGSAIEGMLEHLCSVLVQMAGNMDVRLSELELVGPAERARVVEEWNHTWAEPPAESCVHRLFEEWASRTPDAEAVALGERSLTYRELNGRANRLAHRLVRLGVGPEVRVGVLLERSPEMVSAMLAVLKAGGAYVPLDPRVPVGRTERVLADSGVRVLVTCDGLRSALSAEAGPEVVCVDSEWEDAAPGDVENPSGGAAPRSLAYLAYATGGDGAARGVAVEHDALANLCAWHADAFGITAADRAVQLADEASDTPMWEVWPYLTRGAAVHLAPDEVCTAAEPLRDWLVSRATTAALVPTALLEPLLGLEWPRTAALRWLLARGDGPAARPAGGVPFSVGHGYGPVECTVVAAAGVVAEGSGTRSAGRPIRNTRAYVLDTEICPLPVGIPGELYVGGAQLARGYAECAGLTAERFLPDPFAAEPGARVFRTGERARWLPDGTLERLGRLDELVRIRGFRIVPSEIASVLEGHDSVRRAAVVAREDRPGEKQLVAYVVAKPGAERRADSLLRHLRERLPAYMVPSAVVFLDALPHTPGGELERRVLPAPGVAEESRLRPESELEERLSAIWQELLAVEAVGVEDNFFDLGGHSLLLIRLQARLAAELGREVAAVDLFQYPTVRSLAAQLQGRPEANVVRDGEERGGVRQAALGRRLAVRRR